MKEIDVAINWDEVPAFINYITVGPGRGQVGMYLQEPIHLTSCHAVYRRPEPEKLRGRYGSALGYPPAWQPDAPIPRWPHRADPRQGAVMEQVWNVNPAGSPNVENTPTTWGFKC